MMKKIAIAITTALTVLGLAFTSFACDGSDVADMVNTLYENEKDPVIRQMAVDYALVLTGNKDTEGKTTSGGRITGTYQGNYPTQTITYICLLGQHSARIGWESDGHTFIATSGDEPLNADAYAKNTEDLEKIYALVVYVKSATAGMDDCSKLQYIENCIKGIAPVYVGGCDPVIATTMNNGYCDCDGYALLTYLLGINCGLDIDLAHGYMYGNDNYSHAWNKITINGITYIHDTTGDIPNNTDQYMLVAYGSKIAKDYTEKQ